MTHLVAISLPSLFLGSILLDGVGVAEGRWSSDRCHTALLRGMPPQQSGLEEVAVMRDLSVVRELIVVGLDHTPAGSAALRWAADEGVRRGGRVMAVHIYDREGRADLGVVRDHDAAKSSERIEAHRQLVDVLGDKAAHLDIAICQTDGRVAPSLAEAAEHAGLLVVGKPTDGSHKGLPELLARSCACPVVVVDEHGVAENVETPPQGEVSV
jgi:nucleotide-binding universal stress UspA family protein